MLPLFLGAAERMVIAELFTSTTCGPCVSGNSMLNGLATEKTNFLGVVRYHMNWPNPRNDPFFHYNTQENNMRRNYYGINSVPTIAIDGINLMGGGDKPLWGPTIDDRHGIDSPLFMSAYRNFAETGYLATQGAGTALVEITNESADESYTFDFYAALTESDVAYTGTNGDPIHNQVMIDFISAPWGDEVTLEPGETRLMFYDFDVADTVPILDAVLEPTGEVHVVDASNCELLFWCQVRTSNEVLQGAKVAVTGTRELTLSGVELNDEGGDGEIGPGEEAEVHLTVNNPGSARLDDVRVYVEVDHPGISVLSGIAEIAEIPAGGSHSLDGDDLVIEAASGYDGSIFDLNCHAGSDDGSYGSIVLPTGIHEEPVSEPAAQIPLIVTPGSSVDLSEVCSVQGITRIRLFDASGRCLDEYNDIYELQSAKLPVTASGLYFMTLEAATGTQITKLIILD